MADRLSDVVGSTGPTARKLPTPKQIKSGVATGVAFATAEESLDVSLMDDAFWVSLWQQRGVSRVATLLWAFVNQGAHADMDEDAWTLVEVQSHITAKTLHEYLFAVLRAYGQEAFATGLERLMSQQRERITKTAADISLDDVMEAADGADSTTEPTVGEGRPSAGQ